MNNNVVGIRGEYRRFTSAEIGVAIRMLRESRGIKRAALALEAIISEKTIERAERGEGINEESCRRITRALGLPEDAFTREMFFTTPEEAARIERERDEELRRTHRAVPVAPFKGVRDVMRLFGTCTFLAADQHVKEEHLGEFAEITQALKDSDIAEELPDPDRLKVAEDILQAIRGFEALGYVMKGGIDERQMLLDQKFPGSVVIAFRRSNGAAEVPDEVWVPRRQQLGR